VAKDLEQALATHAPRRTLERIDAQAHKAVNEIVAGAPFGATEESQQILVNLIERRVCYEQPAEPSPQMLCRPRHSGKTHE
jgi:hypothetical protein